MPSQYLTASTTETANVMPATTTNVLRPTPIPGEIPGGLTDGQIAGITVGVLAIVVILVTSIVVGIMVGMIIRYVFLLARNNCSQRHIYTLI